MSLTLGTILTASRDRSAAFFRSRVPDAVVARYLSDAQNELIGAAVRRDPQYLAQTANVVLHLDGTDAPGSAGAGTSGGLPGTVEPDGTFGPRNAVAGALIVANVDDPSAILVRDCVVTAATATSVTGSNIARATNGDQGRVLVVVSGPGAGQRRTILSNTSSQWVISTGSDGQGWATIPTAQSVVQVVEPAYTADNSIGTVTALPATETSTGYLVRLTAAGVPFIDFTQPLTATMEMGVSLPAMQFPLDGTVWYQDGDSGPLEIVASSQRYAATRCPAVYVVGQQLYLAGDAQDWQSVASIALRYVPIAPPFTALTDVFLLPDHARPALVSLAAAFMAMRVVGMPDVSIDPAPHHADAQRAQLAFLANVSAAKRGRGLRPREVW